jgi:putative intracellular protease/amidase
MLEILIALYPGVTQLDFTGPHQVLSRAPDARVTVASLGGRDIEAEGLAFAGLADLAGVERCDVLLVPGGVTALEAALDPGFLAEIRRLGQGARYLTSVCTGSLILGAAGFLKGRRAACHWAWRDLLPLFGATADDARVVRDGRLITGGGVTAGIDFAFALLAELAGEPTAQAVQLGLEYAPDPPFQAGRPELAPPPVLAAYQARMAPLMKTRREQAARAAEALLAQA